MRIHRLKWIAALALMLLCMGAFAVTAHAADTQPLAISAWMSGDKLLIEVHHGCDAVEAVYINNTRVGYLINGRLELPVVDYAGAEQYITVYAANFAGNKSNIVLIQNPCYAPPVTPAPFPSPSPIPASPTPEPTITPTPTVDPVPPPTPPTTDEPHKSNPFTPDGEGEVMDNAVEGDGKEFFTVNTQEGNVFYLVIDRQRSQENVYLLNTVTEQDLMALADESAGISAIPTPAPPEPTPSPTPSPPPPTATPEPAEEPPARSSNNGMILLLVIVVIGVGGAGYYFKIVKGRKETEDTGNEEYEDEYGYGEDTEAEDGYDAEDEREEDEA